MPKPSKFSSEVHERAMRIVYEVRESQGAQWTAIETVPSKIGCTAQALSNWIRKAELTYMASMKILERERLRQINRFNQQHLLEPIGYMYSASGV